jgi:hypothetical protein
VQDIHSTGSYSYNLLSKGFNGAVRAAKQLQDAILGIVKELLRVRAERVIAGQPYTQPCKSL